MSISAAHSSVVELLVSVHLPNQFQWGLSGVVTMPYMISRTSVHQLLHDGRQRPGQPPMHQNTQETVQGVQEGVPAHGDRKRD